MKISVKMQFVDGEFDTLTDNLIAVPYYKHGKVHLCIKSNMNIPIADIKLYDSGLFKDFDATYEDASALCREIARRFNEFPKELKK